ncbi:MAG: AMP-binding protein [Arachnia sp.]
MQDGIEGVRRLLAQGSGLWLADGEGAAPEGSAVVGTSGSTGEPKLVVLSRDALAAAADAAAERLGFAATWHLALDPRYVAGLMVLVRGLRGAGVADAGPGLERLAPRAGRNAVSLVATQLYRALQSPETTAALARFDAVLIGGAPLGPELRTRAEAAGIPVVETYGMSETCGGVVWDGTPLPGTDVRLGERGRILISGPTLFSCYLGRPDLTGEVLRDGAVLTRDRGRLLPDGRLVVDGRIDDVVQSGGVNVDLAEVYAAAAALDPETAVLAVDDEEWGARVVLAATWGTLEEWRARLRPALPAACLPRQLLRVDRIPRGLGGKPDRAELATLARRLELPKS